MVTEEYFDEVVKPIVEKTRAKLCRELQRLSGLNLIRCRFHLIRNSWDVQEAYKDIMAMYHVIDLEMDGVKPADQPKTLERRLQEVYNRLPLRPFASDWQLATVYRDHGTFFAVFEARRVQ